MGYGLWVIGNNIELNSFFYNPSPLTPYLFYILNGFLIY